MSEPLRFPIHLGRGDSFACDGRWIKVGEHLVFRDQSEIDKFLASAVYIHWEWRGMFGGEVTKQAGLVRPETFDRLMRERELPAEGSTFK